MESKQEPQFMGMNEVGKRIAQRGWKVTDFDDFFKGMSTDSKLMALLSAILNQLDAVGRKKDESHDDHPVSFGIVSSLAISNENDIRCAFHECESNMREAPQFVASAIWFSKHLDFDDWRSFRLFDWRLDRIPERLIKRYCGSRMGHFDLWREGTEAFALKKEFCKWRATVRRRRRERKKKSQLIEQ